MAVTAQPKRRDNPWVLIATIAACVLIIATAIWTFAGFMLDVLRGTEPYLHGMSAMRSNAQVVEALGAPIEAGRFFEGNISVSGHRGDARYAVPIHGPKSTATLHIAAHSENGVWAYPTLEVNVADGRVIDLAPAQP
ncbi:cytochrome c oxidase assembly factor 1 family protein [Luteimonas sp. SX5]|uniref:Cytochrome c oxidase assembly factor 1 family protein n=1 Tax=Luteimonas galliterrae TaxID=2940486 RepID=A0ABT0MM48_9GAMM|nr:cytochrome c oxidase assembly factor Coa1 family protein [Luteimonas galliterrae]MCL1635957.1 cytochrome c oxidase assembly factor 1 family protein [Luteimonas galliterrae]